MRIEVKKDLHWKAVSIVLVAHGATIRFERIDGVYVGSAKDGFLSLNLCDGPDQHGKITVPVATAAELVAKFQEFGIYLEGNLDIQPEAVGSDS